MSMPDESSDVGKATSAESATHAAATTAVAVAAVVQRPPGGERRHVAGLQGNTHSSSSAILSHQRVSTSEIEMVETPRLDEAPGTGSDAESEGSNHQGSKSTRKIRLLWKRTGVAVRRFASSFRCGKAMSSKSQSSSEDEVDSKRSTRGRAIEAQIYVLMLA